MNELFGRAHHICVGVADVDAAIAYYESLGIGDWQNYPDLSQYDNDELDVPDRQAFLALRDVYTDAVAGLQSNWSSPAPATPHSGDFSSAQAAVSSTSVSRSTISTPRPKPPAPPGFRS
nr:hypothetical protein [Nocardia abscessus]